jgi:SAM-dependent methyltransferase
MLKFCEPAKGFWVDLGAGKGQVAIPMIETTGNPMTMVDPDAEAMSEGLKTAREKGLQDKLSAVVASAEALPFPDNSVDLLVSRGSIFFWQDPAKGLREVYRVLRPGCRAFIGGGAGSGYPQDATAALIESRKKQTKGEEAEFWQQFVERRRPEQMQKWGEDAGLPKFEVLGRGALSADDERVGQGVWILFEKQPEVITRKAEDNVTVNRHDDTLVYAVRSASGIGSATLSPWNGWSHKVVLRLYLRGLESLTVSNGQVELHGSVASHSGNPQQMSIKQGDRETAVEQDTAYWAEIAVYDAQGNPVKGLPSDGGYFEVALPPALFELPPKSLTVHWIDFYRQ